MTKRPSGVRVRKPAQPLLMLTRGECRHESFDFLGQQFFDAFFDRRIAGRQFGLIAGAKQQPLALGPKINVMRDIPNERPLRVYPIEGRRNKEMTPARPHGQLARASHVGNQVCPRPARVDKRLCPNCFSIE